MFDHDHYVPILKGKDGEYRALKVLSPEVKEQFTPLIDVPRIPWDYPRGRPKKTLHKHIEWTLSRIETSWGEGLPMFPDLYHSEHGNRMEDGWHPLQWLVETARVRSINMIPVTGFGRPKDYQSAIADSSALADQGVCVRLEDDDLGGDLANSLDRLMKLLNATPKHSDLILDFRAIAPEEISGVSKLARSALSRLPYVQEWRSLTLAASGFPVDLSAIEPDSIEKLPRTEVALWRQVVNSLDEVGRISTFGDYGICHPDFFPIDPRTMNISASIRYTTEEDWLVLRGRNVKKYSYRQFHSLSRTLVRRSEYSGRQFSWGDDYIALCALEQVGTGNPMIWRKVGTNHHLTMVTSQIASLAVL